MPRSRLARAGPLSHVREGDTVAPPSTEFHKGADLSAGGAATSVLPHMQEQCDFQVQKSFVGPHGVFAGLD
jgi:hypothetical protein